MKVESLMLCTVSDQPQTAATPENNASETTNENNGVYGTEELDVYHVCCVLHAQFYLQLCACRCKKVK